MHASKKNRTDLDGKGCMLLRFDLSGRRPEVVDGGGKDRGGKRRKKGTKLGVLGQNAMMGEHGTVHQY
jgi:hypothetical protein